MTDTLNFPKGEFTHTELAQANGKTNQQVWTAYQAAIKAGVIVSAGTRPNPSGKGKPSKIWKVADGQPVPLVDKVEVVKVEPVKTVVVSSLLPVTPVVANLITEVDKALPVVKPSVAPETVEVIEVVQPRPAVQNINRNITPTEFLCPFCKNKLVSMETETGFRVWCPINDFTICSCSENPYGHSNTIKNAFEILCQKYSHVKA